MPRSPRRSLWTEAACYHVMNRGQNRATLFVEDADFSYFLGLLGRYSRRFEVCLYHYCLLSNHFHLLLQLPRPRQLSQMMAGMLVAYVRYVQRRYNFVGHVFQGRFKSPAVDAETYLLSCGRYIERNPVTAGLTAEPWTYRWSSCRAYALGESDALLTSNPWYEQLSIERARRQELWRQFLLGEDPKEEALHASEWAIGDEDFRRRLQRPAGRSVPRDRGRPPQ
ncbi:MAG TPA: transposase [Gemmataceae bacterium]|nr:transposase [Gemmataceae bacterium]